MHRKPIREWSTGDLLASWGRALVLISVVFAFGAIYQGPSSRAFLRVWLLLFFGIPVAMIGVTWVWARRDRAD